MILIYLIILSVAYLIGTFPSGLFISRYYGLDDPRKRGSKNIGATNVLRSGHKMAATLTLVLDTLKGALAVGLVGFLTPDLADLGTLAVIIGHVFPIWLKFKGGKGIATAFGAFLILSWPLAVLGLITWFSFIAATRYVSLASLVAAGATPVYALVLGEGSIAITALGVALLVVWTHRENIVRLRKGEEPHLDISGKL